MGNMPDADNRLKQLKYRIHYLMQASKDAAFTEYLRQLQGRVANQERQIQLLTEELEKNVQIYENLQRTAQSAPQPSVPPVSQTVHPVPQPSVPSAPQTVRPVREHRNAEFTIGAAVLSIVGSAFILTAMVLLGMYFMEGLMKGLLLYAVSLIVMVLSEIFLYRRWPRLGMTFSAIGMGGLYISTLINYLVLDNFNHWVALGLTLAITLAVVLLSRKRDAAVYRILGMVAMYVCVLIVPGAEQRLNGSLSQIEFLTVIVMAFAVNMMCLLVPVRKAHTGIHVTHMALNTFFTIIAIAAWENLTINEFAEGNRMWEGVWQYLLFIAMSVLVMQLIFIVQVRWQERQTPGGSMERNVGVCITYGISSLFYASFVAVAANESSVFWGAEYLPYRLLCSAVAVVLCLFPMLVLRKKQEKWFIWYLLNMLVFVIHLFSDSYLESTICVLVLLAASKLLSFTKNFMVRNCDAAVTTIVCLIVLFSKDNSVLLLVAGVVLSLFCVNYWQVYFETILTFTLALYTSMHMLPILKLPVFVGILFVGMLMFNNVKRWHGKGMCVYNVMILLGQAVCYLLLTNPVYRNAYLTYLCMLIFGVATLMICLQKKYHLNCSFKQLVIAIFLTYMALITRTSYPIVNSILLMLIALICVGMGFAVQKKSLRIYGLVLSLVICAKLVLYDFMGANTLQKTILFFVVGVLALIIAAIYMILERSQEKRIRCDKEAE